MLISGTQIIIYKGIKKVEAIQISIVMSRIRLRDRKWNEWVRERTWSNKNGLGRSTL